MNSYNKIEQAKRYTSHMNICFKRITENLYHLEMHNSLLKGVSFNDCIFQEVNLSNSDIDGSRFQDCSLIEVSFKAADIRSLVAVKSNFIKVDFSNSNIANCTFINCSFEECNFSKVQLSKNTFTNCSLSPFNLNHGTAILNTYTNVTFYKTRFKNVFYYQLFTNCTFEDCIMESYLLGYNYGYSKKNFLQLTYTHMGKYSHCPLATLLKKIEVIYTERFMLVNIGILAMNQEWNNYDKAIIACIGFIIKSIEKDIIIQDEQLEFLRMIINLLHKEKKIAPITLLSIYQELVHVLSSFDTLSKDKAYSQLTVLKNELFFAYEQIIDQIKEFLVPKNLTPNGYITLFIEYKKKPEIELVYFLNKIHPEWKAPVKVRDKTGSYLEWIEMINLFLPSITVFLTLVTCIEPIIFWHKDKKTNESSPIIESIDEDDRLLMPKTFEPQSIQVNIIQNINDAQNKVIEEVLVTINDLELTVSNDYKGYNSTNIKKIHITIDNEKTYLK